MKDFRVRLSAVKITLKLCMSFLGCDLLTANGAKKNFVKSDLWLENGYKETIYRIATLPFDQAAFKS
jgi:hypothetical protein